MTFPMPSLPRLPPYQYTKGVAASQHSAPLSDHTGSQRKRSFSISSLKRRFVSSEGGHRSSSWQSDAAPPVPTLFSAFRNLSLKLSPHESVPALDLDTSCSSASSSVLNTQTSLSSSSHFPNPKHCVIADDVFVIANSSEKQPRQKSIIETPQSPTSSAKAQAKMSRSTLNFSKPFSSTARPTSSSSSSSSFDAPSIWSRPSAQVDSDDELCHSSPVLSSRWSVYSFVKLEEENASSKRPPLLEKLGLSTRSKGLKRECTISNPISNLDSFIAAKKHYATKPLPSFPVPSTRTQTAKMMGLVEGFPSPPKRRIPSVPMPSPESPRRTFELFAGEECAVPAAPKPLLLAHAQRTLATDFFDLL